MIGIHEDGLYKLIGKTTQAIVRSTISPCEPWHRIFGHIHYKALSIASKALKGLPKIQVLHDSVYKGCAKGKNVRNSFSSSDSKMKGILDMIHLDMCDRCLQHHSMGMYTILLLLMIILVKLRFIFLRVKMKFSSSSKSSKPL